MPIHSLLYTVLAWAPAQAAPLVVANAGDGGALREVAERLEIDVSTLQALDVADEIDNLEPVALGNVPMDLCTAPRVTIREVRRAVRRASDSLRARDLHEAMSTSRMATLAVRCMDPKPPRRVAARAYAVRGVTGLLIGSPRLAKEDLALARRLDADLEWDEAWPPAAKEGFDAPPPTADAAVMSRLDVFPVPSGARVTIDGEPAAIGDDGTVTVPAGVHLVQVERGSTVSAVEVETRPGELVSVLMPAFFKSSPPDDWAEDEIGRRRLAAVLPQITATGQDVYVPAGDDVWRHRTGTNDWVRLGESAAADAVAASEGPSGSEAASAGAATSGASTASTEVAPIPPPAPVDDGLAGFETIAAVDADVEEQVQVVELDTEGPALDVTTAVAAVDTVTEGGGSKSKDKRDKVRRRPRWGVVATGLGVTAVGAGTFLGSQEWAKTVVQRCAPGEPTQGFRLDIEACSRNQGLYDTLSVANTVGGWTTVGGVLLTAAGFVFQKRVGDRTASLHPTLGPSYAGLQLVIGPTWETP